VAIPAGLAAALRQLSQEAGATLFMTLLAGFQTLLYRYTGQRDMLVGTTIAGRTHAELEALIGCFINTLVLRGRPAGELPFRALLEQTRATALGAYAHQELPFELLIDALQPARDLSHTPLFQVMFILQNAPVPELALGEMVLEVMPPDATSAKFDLLLAVEEDGAALSAQWEYNTDLFDGTTIARMAEHYLTLLAGIVARPDARLADLPMLSPAEYAELIVARNDTYVDYPKRCYHDLFADQVARTPNNVAAIFGAQQLTYRALDERANRLAHHLRGLGAGRGSEVAIEAEGWDAKEALEAVAGLVEAGFHED